MPRPTKFHGRAARAALTATLETFEDRRLLSSTSGGLDTTFGDHGQGRVAVPDTMMNLAVSAAFATPDGHFILVGSAANQNDDGTFTATFTLARFNADGSADMSFGSGGLVTSTPGGAGVYDEVRSVALQGDGKILVGGTGAEGAILVRYNPDGSPDPTFGAGGTLTLQPRGMVDHVTLLADGDILVSGFAGDATIAASDAGRLFLARLNPDGSADAGFGRDGVVTFGDGFSDDNGGVALLPDGHVVVVGDVMGEQGSRERFWYFRPNGKRAAVVDPDGPSDVAAAIAVQPDGKLLVAGGGFTLTRYNAHGSLDPTFGDASSGDAGIVDDNTSQPAGIVLDAGGRILVSGVAISNPFLPMAGVSRFNADGSFDDSFGDTGGVYLPHSVTAAGPVILTPDGDVLVAGANDPPDGVGRAFSLTRLSGHIGIALPTATLEAGDVTIPRQRSATIRVTYASPTGIDPASLTGNELFLSSNLDGNGDRYFTHTLVGDPVTNADGSITGTYELLPEDSPAFSYLDDGTHEVWTNDGVIADLNGGPLESIDVGSFRVNIPPPPPDTPPPTAHVDAPYVTAAGTVSTTVTITFIGHGGVDESTIGDLYVEGAAGYLHVTLVSKTVEQDGSVTAAYAVGNADGSPMTAAQNGRYALVLDDRQPVLDNDGTPMADPTVGSFRVMIPGPPGVGGRQRARHRHRYGGHAHRRHGSTVADGTRKGARTAGGAL